MYGVLFHVCNTLNMVRRLTYVPVVRLEYSPGCAIDLRSIVNEPLLFACWCCLLCFLLCFFVVFFVCLFLFFLFVFWLLLGFFYVCMCYRNKNIFPMSNNVNNICCMHR